MQSFAPEEAFRLIASELIQSQVHTAHPQCFGLFNPAPTAMSTCARSSSTGHGLRYCGSSGIGRRSGAWLDALDARAAKNVVVVAMANKLARIAWAVLFSGEDYRPNSNMVTAS